METVIEDDRRKQAQVEAAALEVDLKALSEPLAGLGRTPGGESQERQAAAELTRCCLDPVLTGIGD